MYKVIATIAFLALVIGVKAQKFTFGPVKVPNESTSFGFVKDDMFSGFSSDVPNPELYYNEADGYVYIYVVSLKKDLSFNGIKLIRINTANIAPGNFLAEGVEKEGYTSVNIYTRAKNVVETFTFFDFNMPTSEPIYDYALESNINIIDKNKAGELVKLLNAKQKK